MLPDPNTPPIDHRHLAEKLALAERNDHRLAGAVDLGDVDPASSTTNSSRPVEPSSKMISSTSNSSMHFSMAMVTPRPLRPCSVFETNATRELRPASILPRKHVSRERRRCKRPGGYGLS